MLKIPPSIKLQLIERKKSRLELCCPNFLQSYSTAHYFHVTTRQKHAKNVSIKATIALKQKFAISLLTKQEKPQERFHKQLKGEADF